MTEPVVPRLPTRSSKDTEGETARVLRKLEAKASDLSILQILANSPQAFRPFVLMSDALMGRATLPARIREIVILAMAVEVESGYEWAQHVPMSEQAGVSAEERELLRAGWGAQLDDDAMVALAAAREILSDDGISDEVWARAIATWGDEAALDLVLSIGWWGRFVPLILKNLKIEGTEEST